MMKSFFKKLAFVMALAMVVSLAAPAAKTAVAAEDKKPLAIAYQEGAVITALNLVKVGDTEDLRFVYAPTNWKDLDIKWSSSNENVVSVDANGVVKAEAAGTATISVAVGTETASIEVYSVDTKTFVATMGTAENREMTEATIEVGEAIDFAFYGIYDYSADRYRCDWFAVDPDGVIELDDTNGFVTAKKSGTAKLSLAVYNLVTGLKTDVAPCIITVPAEEPEVTPAPAKSLTAKQTTEDEIVVTFTGVDVSKLNKFNIEVYEQYENDYEYIWQLFNIKADATTNTVTLYGYDELLDGVDYVVRLVEEENGAVVTEDGVAVEDEFTASVGPVARVEAAYASYLNNQGVWFFKNKAYTNGSEGEEIITKLSYKLYDANDINVTDHYATVGYSNVRYEIINDDLAAYVNFVDDDQLSFSEILDEPLKIMVTYEDYDERVTGGINVKSYPLTLMVEKAPEYKVNAIDNWVINNTDNDGNWVKEWGQDIALNDDYDYTTDTLLSNHELVLWFTDNYGNKFVTNTIYADGTYKTIEGSDKFTNEGYEIRYESRNPQILVVGDEEEATKSNIINTKKVGSAAVNVTLHNVLRDYEDKTLVSYMDVIRIPVKAERKLTTVSAASLNVTSDSRYWIAENGNYEHDDRFTKGTVKVEAYDQYGVEWGSVNVTAAASTYIDIEVVKTTLNNNAAVTLLIADHENLVDLGDYDGLVWTETFDGYDLFEEAGDPNRSTSTVQYAVTVTDEMKDIEKTAKFTVTMKQPTEDADGNMVVSSVLKLNASDVGITDLNTSITVIEQSKNLLDVNYKDNITLITSEGQFNELFSKSVANDNRTVATKGALFLVVYNSKNEIVPLSTGADTIGIAEVDGESGNYILRVAALNGGSYNTEFAVTGNYKVKLIQVTNTDKSVADAENSGIVTGYSAIYSKNFKVNDNRTTITMDNQKNIFLGADALNPVDGYTAITDITDIAEAAFTYSVDLSKANPDDKNRVTGSIVAARYRVSEKQNYAVIQDVFVKVLLDTNKNGKVNDEKPDGDFYYVEIPVDRTVRLEDTGMANGDSVAYGKDPLGDKMR